jgi:hypothetical protein
MRYRSAAAEMAAGSPSAGQNELDDELAIRDQIGHEKE